MNTTVQEQATHAAKRVSLQLRPPHQTQDEFLAIASHELRSPLAAISNALLLIEQAGSQDALVRQAVGIMKRQVSHMTRLMDNLLDFSRLARGKVELRKEPLDLARVVCHAVETSHPLLDERHHHLTVVLPPEPLWVEADATRLQQVLVNLMVNAAKYTPPGGHILVTAKAEGGQVVFRVRDDGIGIPPNLLPRVFEPYTQGPGRGEGRAAGLGVGLALVKYLVALHGGSVQVDSEGPNKGSEFEVRLPSLPHTAGARIGLRCLDGCAVHRAGPRNPVHPAAPRTD